MNTKQTVAKTLALVAITVATNAMASNLKELPVTGDKVDACDISGVRMLSAPQMPPGPPGFPAPPSPPRLIEVSFYSSHPILINVPKNEDANAVKEKITRMREDSACKSGEKK